MTNLGKLLVFGIASFAASLSFAQSSPAQNSELNPGNSVANNARPALNETVIVRVDNRDNSASIVSTGAQAQSPEEAQKIAQTANFQPLSQDKVRSELDKDGATSTWFWHNPWRGGWGAGYAYYPNTYWGGVYPSYYPSYDYYGYNYAPYYNYNVGPYNYYYYGGGYAPYYSGGYGYGFGGGFRGGYGYGGGFRGGFRGGRR